MRCADCRDLLSAYLDAEWPPELSGDVRDHLARCAGCARAYDDLAATSVLLQDGLVRHAAPDILRTRIGSALAETAAHVPSEIAEPRRTMVPARWLRHSHSG